MSSQRKRPSPAASDSNTSNKRVSADDGSVSAAARKLYSMSGDGTPAEDNASDAAAAAVAATSAAPANPSSNKEGKIATFLNRTYSMLENPKLSKIIHWNAAGDTVVVADVMMFTKDVIGLYFKHSNFASFVRQLNMYGFSKVKMTHNRQEFKHPLFYRGGKANLWKMGRKPTKYVAQKARNKKVAEGLVEEIEGLKKRQAFYEQRMKELEAKNAHLETENSHLWQQMTIAQNRQTALSKKMRHVMMFLYELFGDSSNSLGSGSEGSGSGRAIKDLSNSATATSSSSSADTPQPKEQTMPDKKKIQEVLRVFDNALRDDVNPVSSMYDNLPSASLMSGGSLDVGESGNNNGDNNNNNNNKSKNTDIQGLDQPTAASGAHGDPSDVDNMPAPSLTRSAPLQHGAELEGPAPKLSRLLSHDSVDLARLPSTDSAFNAIGIERLNSLASEADALGMADSLQPTPSLMEFADVLNGEKLGAKGTRDEYSEFVNGLQKHFDDQDNTLRRISTIESTLPYLKEESTA